MEICGTFGNLANCTLWELLEKSGLNPHYISFGSPEISFGTLVRQGSEPHLCSSMFPHQSDKQIFFGGKVSKFVGQIQHFAISPSCWCCHDSRWSYDFGGWGCNFPMALWYRCPLRHQYHGYTRYQKMRDTLGYHRNMGRDHACSNMLRFPEAT